MLNSWYDLQNEESLDAAISDLKGFWKLWSACLLQSVSLPTLRGMIVTRRYPEIHEQLHSFLEEVEATTALIRHDIQNESPPHPRGGFLASEHLLPEILDFFFGLNRIVAVYEPADPLLNSYNLNALFESATDVWVEVLGPGFDASDLQRGDLSPHEVFSIALAADGKVLRMDRAHRVDQEEYEESKRLREEKIRRKMEESPTPELAREIRKDLKLPERTKNRLRAVGSPLDSGERYIPIPETLLTDTVSAIARSGVIQLFRTKTNVGFPLNFSTSFIDRGKRQIFWDVVSPDLKFQGLRT